jgi:hypothetical protein
MIDRREFIKFITGSGVVLAMDPASAYDSVAGDFSAGISFDGEGARRIWFFDGDTTIVPAKDLAITEFCCEGSATLSRGDQQILAFAVHPDQVFRWSPSPWDEIHIAAKERLRFSGVRGSIVGRYL